MKTVDTIMDLAYSNNGFITSGIITGSNISRGFLSYMHNKGMLEKVERGVYVVPEVLEDEMYNYAIRFKKGIYSHETALFLWGLTDRTPVSYTMTFPKGYNLTNAKEAGVTCIQNIKETYSQGIVQINTPSGNTVNCYCIEKTLCDILRPRTNVDISVVSDAFKRYVKLKDRNIPLLSDYAKKLNVEDKVRNYLEVLL